MIIDKLRVKNPVSTFCTIIYIFTRPKMENMLIVAIITTVIFFAIKFIEMRFINKNKELTPLKFLVRDLVIVFISSLVAGFFFFNSNKQISEFVNTITDTKVIPEGAAQVFTDAPGF